MNDYTTSAPLHSTATFRLPEYRWQWCFNGDWHAVTVSVVRAPNWFYRFTQRAILGIHWRRIPPTTTNRPQEK